jgi:hypothetical protein
MRYLIAPALLAAALPVQAETPLRPAPDYFVEALFSLTLAEAIAQACPELGMDLFAAQTQAGELTERLVADGFDRTQPFAQMIDPAPALRDLQAAFLETYPIAGADAEAVCAAGHAEMEKGTAIGTLLIDAALLPRTAPDAPEANQ